MGGEKKCLYGQWDLLLLAFAYQGKDIVFRFIIVYSKSLRDFGP
jgi:hypothetical protein